MAGSLLAAAAVVQASVAGAGLRWYGGLLKPSFSPPVWLAAASLVLVSAAAAVGLYRVLRRPDYLPDRPAALRIFAIGLALNVLWSWLFFAGRHPTVALAGAGALTVFAASAAYHFTLVERRAGLFLLPWVLAAGFAFLVDLSIALRNG